MPTVFIGHGSPMNALEKNSWTEHLVELAKTLPKPKAIVCVSAHWVTPNIRHLNLETPRTIHDFYGFPEALYQVQYPAPGHILKGEGWSVPDAQWGFDHGTWSVLKHMYPDAKIPVTQLSLSAKLSMKEHTEIGHHLRKLREQNILVLGSGNITHNLRDVDFSAKPKTRDWAVDFDGRTKEALEKRDCGWLWNERSQYSKLWQQAHPTPEHYWPLLYILGASDENDKLSFPFEEFQNGSLAMRTVLYT